MANLADTLLPVVEDNVLAYYKGLAQSLGGQFFESDQTCWFTTAKHSLVRFTSIGCGCLAARPCYTRNSFLLCLRLHKLLRQSTAQER